MADDAEAVAMVEQLSAMDAESCAGVIVSVMQARPEIAPVLVSVALPDLTYAPSTILTSKRSHGTVKSFNEKSGFGFIACQELKDMFGRDVFVHAKQMRGVSVGEAVSFAIVLNKDNHPQGFDIVPEEDGKGKGKGYGMDDAWGGWGCKGGDKGMEKGMKGMYAAMPGWGGFGGIDMSMGGGKGWDSGKGDGGKGKSKDASYGKAGGARSDAGPDVMEELGQGVGVLKSFNQKNGYGFIDCPEMKELGYQDVFLHQAQVGNFNVGDQVMFTCFLNSKGKAQAKDLCRPGEASGGSTGGKGKTKGGRRESAGAPDVQEVLGELAGTIKSFNEKSGYGFITCPEVTELGYNDVFLHHAQKGNFGVGDSVTFTGYLNKKGQVQAMDLQYAQGNQKKRKLM